MISIGIVGIDFGDFLTSFQPSSVGEMLIDTLQMVDRRYNKDDHRQYFEMISSGEYTFTSKNVHRRPWG